jgi:hypothetical protein
MRIEATATPIDSTRLDSTEVESDSRRLASTFVDSRRASFRLKNGLPFCYSCAMKPLFDPSGGIRKTDAFTFVSIIQNETWRFCETFLTFKNDPKGRLFDQMTREKVRSMARQRRQHGHRQLHAGHAPAHPPHAQTDQGEPGRGVCRKRRIQ